MIDRQEDRKQVAWDIETTGFSWSDQITVSGFWLPSGRAELIINSGGEPLNSTQFETQLETVSEIPVSVTMANDERALLTTMRDVLFERFDREYNRLVAFNAESWKSGFDLPFLRTRCIAHDIEWVFDNIHFADLWDSLKKRLNTTHTAYGGSTEINLLTGAHDLLLSDSQPLDLIDLDQTENHAWYQENPYDPFTDSGSAVYCYKEREFLPILQHNLADIHRTWEFGELVRACVSSKDLTTKKL